MHAILFNPPIEDNYLGHQFSEIYKDRIYAPFVEDKKDLVILDVGANIGITTYYFSRYARKVVSLEPSKEHFAILEKMRVHNGLTNVSLINKGLYMKSGSFPLYHNSNKTMFSLNPAVSDGSSPEESIDCITVQELFEQEKLDQVDLLKLDVEGAETEILSHSSFKEVAPKIKTVIAEYHAWNTRHRNQLGEALENAGFQVGIVPSSADLFVGVRNV